MEGRLFSSTVNLRTKIMGFRGFDSSIILILRGGIPRPMGNLPESLSQAILVGIILVGRLGVFILTGKQSAQLRLISQTIYLNWETVCPVKIHTIKQFVLTGKQSAQLR